MAGQPPVIGIVGMKALRKDVANILDDDGPLNKAMIAAGKAAVEPVAAATAAALPKVDVQGQSSRLVDTVRWSGTRTGASVRMGTRAVPWAGWVEFGGHRRLPHDSSRPFVPGGRYMFPAAERLKTSAAQLYSDGIAKVFASYGWTNETTDGAIVHD